MSNCYSSGIWLYTAMSLCGLHGPHETEHGNIPIAGSGRDEAQSLVLSQTPHFSSEDDLYEGPFLQFSVEAVSKVLPTQICLALWIRVHLLIHLNFREDSGLFLKAAWDVFEDMAFRFGHKMSPPRAHVFEAGPQADRTVLGGSGNFGRWHVAERRGSLGSVLGVFSSLALSWFVLCFCSPRTKEQSLSLAAPSMVFCQST